MAKVFGKKIPPLSSATKVKPPRVRSDKETDGRKVGEELGGKMIPVLGAGAGAIIGPGLAGAALATGAGADGIMHGKEIGGAVGEGFDNALGPKDNPRKKGGKLDRKA